MIAAAARAAHLLVDGEPAIFRDPLAERLLGAQAEELLAYHRRHGAHPVLAGARTQTTVRSRYVEDHLAARRPRQYVLLGAGLDTFACRAPAGVRVFEVDHPASQEWKRRLLTEAEIPTTATFVPVDFEHDPLAERLEAHGFDPGEPALVAWLGVTMYLTWDGIDRTLATIARFAPGTELVFDYVLAEHLRDEAGAAYAAAIAHALADGGEPWLTCPTPDELTDRLAGHGFTGTRHVTLRDAVPPEVWQRDDALTPDRLLALVHTGLHRDSAPPHHTSTEHQRSR